MKIKSGVTRHCFLIGNKAVKIPNVTNGWGNFLRGLLANIQENLFSSLNDSRMAKVKFCLKGGWLLIMDRCEPLSDREFKELVNMYEFEGVPVEYKKDSFGWNGYEIVAIDYGS